MSVSIQDELDTSLDWRVFRIREDQIYPLSFTIQGTTRGYFITLIPHYTRREIFMTMDILQEGETLLRKTRVKAGLRYDIEEDVSLYFQTIRFNRTNMLFEGDFGTRIVYAYVGL